MDASLCARRAGGPDRQAGGLPSSDLEPVELGRVLAEYLAAGAVAHPFQPVADQLEWRRIEAGRMREVGREQDVVLADRIGHPLEIAEGALEPEGRVPMLLEILR